MCQQAQVQKGKNNMISKDVTKVFKILNIIDDLKEASKYGFMHIIEADELFNNQNIIFEGIIFDSDNKIRYNAVLDYMPYTYMYEDLQFKVINNWKNEDIDNTKTTEIPQYSIEISYTDSEGCEVFCYIDDGEHNFCFD